MAEIYRINPVHAIANKFITQDDHFKHYEDYFVYYAVIDYLNFEREIGESFSNVVVEETDFGEESILWSINNGRSVIFNFGILGEGERAGFWQVSRKNVFDFLLRSKSLLNLIDLAYISKNKKRPKKYINKCSNAINSVCKGIDRLYLDESSTSDNEKLNSITDHLVDLECFSKLLGKDITNFIEPLYELIYDFDFSKNKKSKYFAHAHKALAELDELILSINSMPVKH